MSEQPEIIRELEAYIKSRKNIMEEGNKPDKYDITTCPKCKKERECLGWTCNDCWLLDFKKVNRK